MTQWAWRTQTGEDLNCFKGENSSAVLSWYASADVPGEKVLVYSVEKTTIKNNTSIRHKDRYLNRVTDKGTPCSGKITKYLGKYNLS